MAASWFSCNACNESDPTQDTVKVDPNLLNKDVLLDKENVEPLQFDKQQQTRRASTSSLNAEEQQRYEAEEAAAAQAARLREELEEEVERCESEKAAQRLALATEEKRLASYEEAARADAAAAAAAAAEEDQRARVAEEQASLARKEAGEEVDAWCKKNGYEDVNTQKKLFRGGSKFPLHSAVKYNNDEIIGMMLLLGANKDVKDSKGETPCQLAAKLNKNGSHDQILAKLR